MASNRTIELLIVISAKLIMVQLTTEQRIYIQGRRNKGGRRGNRPPCPSAGGARGAKVPFQFITVNLINLLLI